MYTCNVLKYESKCYSILFILSYLAVGYNRHEGGERKGKRRETSEESNEEG